MKKTYIKNREYRDMVSKLGRRIITSDWRPDYIVGITRGGLYSALLLSHYLEVPMYTLNVSLRDSTFGPETNLWMAEDAFGYCDDNEVRKSDPNSRKNILLVDDINDSGDTFNWIMTDWASGCLPNDPAWETDIWNHNVKFAVTVDNLASKCRVPMDFSAKEINKHENPEWIVFPWENWWE